MLFCYADNDSTSSRGYTDDESSGSPYNTKHIANLKLLCVLFIDNMIIRVFTAHVLENLLFNIRNATLAQNL